MRQREISRWRVLHAFRSPKEVLTEKENRGRTGLCHKTSVECLNELLKRRILNFTIAADGKTKKYALRDKSQFGRPLEIKNKGRQGRKGQVERLRLLGLEPVWLRPKPPPDWRQSDKMISDILDPNYPHTSSYVSCKTGMRYKSDGKGVHMFSIRHQQRSMIPKATKKGRALARALHDGDDKLGIAPHRYKDEDPPLKTDQWIEYKSCPKCGEWTPELPCRECGYVALREERGLEKNPAA